MVQDLPEKARELEEALGMAVVVAERVAEDSEQGENASARIVVIEPLTNKVCPVMRLIVPNVGHQ